MSEDLAGLEEQRDVLLKSLRDLEQEREAGEIGDDDYAALKDDYTARAATVLRAIEARPTEGGRRRAGAAGRARPAGSGRRRPPGVRVAGSRPSGSGAGAGRRPSRSQAAGESGSSGSPAGAGRRPSRSQAGVGTSQPGSQAAAGTRRSGSHGAGTQSPSDGPGRARSGARRSSPNVPVGRRQRTLAISLVVAFAVVAMAGISVVLFAGGRTPGDPVTGSVPTTSVSASRVDEALALETDGKAVDALRLYDEILASDPDNVEALAYRGWLLKRAGLPDEALVSLDRAVAVDPTFADAHFFRGMVLYQDRDDPAGAVSEFEAFLANNPPPDFVDAVGEVLAQARAAAAAKATPTTTTAAPGP